MVCGLDSGRECWDGGTSGRGSLELCSSGYRYESRVVEVKERR